MLDRRQYRVGGKPILTADPAATFPPAGAAAAEREKAIREGARFVLEVNNRDLGVFIELENVEKIIATFSAPNNQQMIVEEVACVPTQIEALGDVVLTIKVNDVPLPFYTRRGMIGRWESLERVAIGDGPIIVSPTRTFQIGATISQDYRGMGGVDRRIEFRTRIRGYYVRAY